MYERQTQYFFPHFSVNFDKNLAFNNYKNSLKMPKNNVKSNPTSKTSFFIHFLSIKTLFRRKNSEAINKIKGEAQKNLRNDWNADDMFLCYFANRIVLAASLIYSKIKINSCYYLIFKFLLTIFFYIYLKFKTFEVYKIQQQKRRRIVKEN